MTITEDIPFEEDKPSQPYVLNKYNRHEMLNEIIKVFEKDLKDEVLPFYNGHHGEEIMVDIEKVLNKWGLLNG